MHMFKKRTILRFSKFLTWVFTVQWLRLSFIYPHFRKSCNVQLNQYLYQTSLSSTLWLAFSLACCQDHLHLYRHPSHTLDSICKINEIMQIIPFDYCSWMEKDSADWLLHEWLAPASAPCLCFSILGMHWPVQGLTAQDKLYLKMGRVGHQVINCSQGNHLEAMVGFQLSPDWLEKGHSNTIIKLSITREISLHRDSILWENLGHFLRYS